MKRFIGIMQFLTTIPLPFNTGIDTNFHKSAVYFPVVGLILGLIYAGSAFFLNRIIEPALLSVIIVFIQVIMTGGLHIDGFGDTADGLFSYRDRERILEIMKDPRLGTNGFIGIFFLLTFKIILTYYILIHSLVLYIVFMPVFGRFAQICTGFISKPAKENGMGNIFIGKISKGLFTATCTITIIILTIISFSFKCSYMAIFIFIPFMAFSIILIRQFVYKKINGLTGDVLGAISESIEVIFLSYVLIYNMLFTLKL
ncbi:MAG: cobalamin 5'-phosphate synthase [Spirochaetes bacterium GWF1_31_7]|nr:MAG: cobalamin 5'-phosphate synthase [Spirochaetes bacterium GWE1_32_154]OHD46127.1 MAG: cobalamin 5'-phosphate synthase [Spirochaetes bacterium GWE2_31_10]OHD47526.1 MAG: cobalamin 5'-phosphate synthase [Spirochaetes bacterium GWF1_31_7]